MLAGREIEFYAPDNIDTENQEPVSVGKSWSMKYDFKQYDGLFEYYMRRGKKLYFRNATGTLVIENNDFYVPFMSKNPKYGDLFELNFFYQ